MKTTFADRMRLAMDRAGLKPIELHEKTGISKPSISEYLSGNYEPKQRNLYKIAKALGVQPSYLMGITPLELPAPPAASEKPHKKGVLIPVLGVVRAGETLGLSWDGVDMEHRTIRIHAQIQRLAMRGKHSFEYMREARPSPAAARSSTMTHWLRRWSVGIGSRPPMKCSMAVTTAI